MRWPWKVEPARRTYCKHCGLGIRGLKNDPEIFVHGKQFLKGKPGGTFSGSFMVDQDIEGGRRCIIDGEVVDDVAEPVPSGCLVILGERQTA